MYIYICACMYVCMYVYVDVCIYIYMYTFIVSQMADQKEQQLSTCICNMIAYTCTHASLQVDDCHGEPTTLPQSGALLSNLKTMSRA